VRDAVSTSLFRERFVFTGFCSDTDDAYAAADLYALTSREDPFPTVIMEALDVGVPVVAFEGVGGFEDLLRSGAGSLVPGSDVEAFSGHVQELLSNANLRRKMGEEGAARIETNFQFGAYAARLLSVATQEAETRSA
jgi:glycosyltransferase involved in cell wall biosynthesis